MFIIAEIIKESVTSENEGQTAAVTTEVKREASGSQTVEYIISFILGLVDILLTFRFILKLTGASTSSSFVNLIYDLTKILTLPFEGIFSRGSAQIMESTSIFEPATLVAIVVYAVLAWGIVKLIRIFSKEKQV
ncbi:MAG: YggT family protein [Candidatus Dojkabacteria bacterium]|nr:YggT family protein [Candidatus Dojkabacteria bacterium]